MRSQLPILTILLGDIYRAQTYYPQAFVDQGIMVMLKKYTHHPPTVTDNLVSLCKMHHVFIQTVKSMKSLHNCGSIPCWAQQKNLDTETLKTAIMKGEIQHNLHFGNLQ